ncbi:MAG: hypothetical protein H6Q69_4107 [Firmicutes bacterium]|nr:hypothetical protein [Bacillota bacterium]
MGKFSDDIRKRLRGQITEPTKDVEFSCGNCLNIFTFSYNDVYKKASGDLEFVPEPECPRCGATEELIFSDYGQEKIEDMLFSGQIRKQK